MSLVSRPTLRKTSTSRTLRSFDTKSYTRLDVLRDEKLDRSGTRIQQWPQTSTNLRPLSGDDERTRSVDLSRPLCPQSEAFGR
jgi:hypothetical protein